MAKDEDGIEWALTKIDPAIQAFIDMVNDRIAEAVAVERENCARIAEDFRGSMAELASIIRLQPR